MSYSCSIIGEREPANLYSRLFERIFLFISGFFGWNFYNNIRRTVRRGYAHAPILRASTNIAGPGGSVHVQQRYCKR